MTKGQAMYQFLKQFMNKVYASTEVPESTKFPFMTYDLYTGAFGDGEQSMELDLWFLTDSEAVPNAKAQEISKAIGLGGQIITYDGGAMWIKRGSPFCQSLADTNNTNVKRRLIQLSVEYLSQD